jgi:hypothetical protein
MPGMLQRREVCCNTLAQCACACALQPVSSRSTASDGSAAGRVMHMAWSVRCAVLCCAVLCCAVLCCAVLCCAALRCAVLCSAVLCCVLVKTV